MSGRFVVREGHFHIADKDTYVLTGWFEEEAVSGTELFSVFLDRKKADIRVLSFSDDSVRQKYAKLDMKVITEYVILVKLPQDLSRYRRLFLCLADGTRDYKHSVYRRQLCGNRLGGVCQAGEDQCIRPGKGTGEM